MSYCTSRQVSQSFIFYRNDADQRIRGNYFNKNQITSFEIPPFAGRIPSPNMRAVYGFEISIIIFGAPLTRAIINISECKGDVTTTPPGQKANQFKFEINNPAESVLSTKYVFIQDYIARLYPVLDPRKTYYVNVLALDGTDGDGNSTNGPYGLSISCVQFNGPDGACQPGYNCPGDGGVSGTSGTSGTGNQIQPGKDVDVTVSPCKGDFAIISPGSTQSTAKVTNFNGKTLTLKYSYDRSNPDFPLYLNPNIEHFVNFKWKKAEYDTRFGSASFQAKFYYEKIAGIGPETPICTDQAVSQYFINERANIIGLKNEQNASVQFSSTKSIGGVESVTGFSLGFPITTYPQASNYEYCISECKGSFVPPKNNSITNTNCKGNTSITGKELWMTIPNTVTPDSYGTPCLLEKNKNYYLNIRTRDPVSESGTCSDSNGCSMDVFLQYYPVQYSGIGKSPTSTSTCASFSGRIVKWEGSQVNLTPFANDSVIAVEIDTEKYPLLKLSKNYKISWVSTSDISAYAEVEVAITTCPGDFNSSDVYGSRCEAHSFPPGSLNATVGSSGMPMSTCELPVGTKKIYVNFRLTKTDGTGGGSCNISSCPIWVNISR